jgi:MFS family permease
VRSDALLPLREPAFRMFFAGRTVATLGNAIAPIAIAFAVIDISDSAGALGLVLAARSVPQVLLILLGGVLADRFPRHLVLVVSNVVSALTQATVAALLFTGTADIWHLVALEAVNGASSAFLLPAAAGLTPQTVPASVLQQANALLRLGSNGALISGAALGGLLVATVGPAWGLVIDATTFAAGAVLFGRIKLPSGERVQAENFLTELRDGWDEFRSRTWLWVIVVQFAFVNAAYAWSFMTLGPIIANQTIGRAAWGLVIAAQTTGMIAGGLVALRLRPSRPLFVGTAAILLWAPLLVILAEAPNTLALVATAVVAGVGWELFAVYWDLSLQQHVPGDKLSRVSSYDALGSFVFVPVGLVLAGPLAVALGEDGAVALGAAVVIVATCAALAVPAVRHLRRTDEPAPEHVTTTPPVNARRGAPARPVRRRAGGRWT